MREIWKKKLFSDKKDRRKKPITKTFVSKSFFCFYGDQIEQKKVLQYGLVGPNTYELIKKADEEDHILGRL